MWVRRSTSKQTMRHGANVYNSKYIYRTLREFVLTGCRTLERFLKTGDTGFRDQASYSL